MRVIIVGDTHIGAIYGLGGPNQNGGNTRIDDFEATLNHIIDYAIETKADALIQTGDLFEFRTPSPEDIEVVNRAFKRLSRANITSVIIMGNHDYRRSGEVFTSAISSLAIKDYPNVRIVLEPQVLTLISPNNGETDVVLLPYRDRRMYPGKTNEEDSWHFDKHISRLIDSCSGARPIISIGHNFFFEGSYKSYAGNELMASVETFKRCDMTAMGHYHGFKVLNKKEPAAFYTGSMERINFGDAGVDKFFMDYDTESKKVKVLKCPSRDLYDGYSDLSMYDFMSFKKALKEEIEGMDINNKIVRIKLAVKDKISSSIKKSEIKKMLYDKGAFFVSRVNIEPIFKRLVRDNVILEEKGDMAKFQAFVGSQDFDDEVKQQILSKAEEIID